MINANQGVSTTVTSGHGLGGDTKCITSTYTVAAAITDGQVIPMVSVPSGARIVDAKVSVSGVADGTYNLGDTTEPARFMSAAAPGSRLTTGDLYLYKKSTILNVTAVTAPTGTTGAIKLAVFYVVDGVSPRDV
jgi:hypothetical protein